jgi:hypothetical protein
MSLYQYHADRYHCQTFTSRLGSWQYSRVQGSGGTLCRKGCRLVITQCQMNPTPQEQSSTSFLYYKALVRHTRKRYVTSHEVTRSGGRANFNLRHASTHLHHTEGHMKQCVIYVGSQKIKFPILLPPNNLT